MIYDTIQEYDIKGDSILEIGKMTEAKGGHFVSVVKYNDIFQWCK